MVDRFRLIADNPVEASVDSVEQRRAILFAFGDLRFIDPAITADRLYQALIVNGIWLARRVPKNSTVPMSVLFYQSGAGFRATATLRDVMQSTSSDWRFPGSGGRLFPVKLVLSDVISFSRVIDMREVLADLSFVPNKAKWGQAFQNTPRFIPYRDFDIVRRRAGQP